MIKYLNPANWSLKRKLSGIILLIFLIPATSFGLLTEIERTLVENLKSNLSLSAQLIGSQLNEHEEWFDKSQSSEATKIKRASLSRNENSEQFVFPLRAVAIVDGLFEEWTEHEVHRYFQSLARHSPERTINPYTSIGVLLGNLNANFYVSIEIKNEEDSRLKSRKLIDNESPKHDLRSTHTDVNANAKGIFELEFIDQTGLLQTLLITPLAEGNIPVQVRIKNNRAIDWRFKAYWKSSESGEQMEIKFPAGVKPLFLRTSYSYDLLNGDKTQRVKIATSTKPSRLIWPNQKIASFVEDLSIASAQRVWILDNQGRVLGMNGDLSTDKLAFSSNPLLQWIFSLRSSIKQDPRENELHLDSPIVNSALNGVNQSDIEKIDQNGQSIALASYGIKANNSIVGVVLIEENVARVQVVQQKALIRMFSIIFIVIIAVMIVISWYAGKIVGRIRLLNSALENAVDENGRMEQLRSYNIENGDEIDDLNRAFFEMNSRLFSYNDYLEKLASRLSHELRTPIAIVRSSLDNLLLETETESARETVNRAIEGNMRLGEIVTRMRQSTSVKQAMQTAEKETINIVPMLGQIVEGYNSTFANYQFNFVTEIDKLDVSLAPELFMELIDKVVSNAVDFSPSEKPIDVSLTRVTGSTTRQFSLNFENFGPTIPDENKKQIFDSLVSIRSAEYSQGANLGLGLYVAKLIAEFHGFEISVNDKIDQQGVCISFTIFP